eukprot:CAMPEP_0183319354 /NCGR_PEP_ID=MMETSP0160_2-20130417/63314_1 /TAXON_ID=2839 ORGANISM="Odontella Sinensis, Strain Grunow 1884" /NCGR_SAMPLE_ID=MMETSP0160_2 /ASSEMBLY_ACC=CAM_ASM_000250 /LENGTH=379 /DNA_ID=CAMNT_0025485809 /DNA_START=93 /DNA_END=1232 /DNA_ORIENTATION=+
MTSSPSLHLESRLRGALWGLFSGDALAAPTHWYYGGYRQVKADYGPSGITDYVKPAEFLAGSILNKSNVNGGGRGSFDRANGVSIIGDVINHGKRGYWHPSKSYHYHATLQRGENTLEAQIARVLMRSVTSTGGTFDADHFRKAYVDFMTTPGSHNDTYASTCHRMFFANMIFKKLPPEKCPDNDRHNVDTIDGLVLPTVTILAMGGRIARGEDPVKVREEARVMAERTAGVTRNSSALERASGTWSDLLLDILAADEGADAQQSLNKAARSFGLRRMPVPNGRDEMSACYLDGSLPTLLDMISKYSRKGDAWTGLLANANVGGENVHRGAVLGAALGASVGEENLGPQEMLGGLYEREKLAEEIDAFVRAVTRIENDL